MRSRFVICWLVAVLVQHVHGQVIINEVFYHAPDDVDRLEWIELANAGADSIDISGWALSNGVEYTVPQGTAIEPGKYLVICRDVGVFREFYDVSAMGEFARSLRNGGESLELRDASGNLVDAVSYTDRAPESVSADGYGASIERISPTLPNDATNWASSSLPDDANTAGGTPGKRNNRYSREPLPNVADLHIAPLAPTPGKSIAVRCAAESRAGLQKVEMLYQTVNGGRASEEIVIPMSETTDGKYEAIVPGQDAGVLVRIRVRAIDKNHIAGYHSDQNDLRPSVSLYVMKEPAPATIPLAFIIDSKPEVASRSKRALQPSGGPMARMVRTRVQMTADSTFDLGAAWSRLTVDQDLSKQTYLGLRELFRQQLSKREQMVDEVLRDGNMRSAMQRAQLLATKSKSEFEQSLKQVLPAAAYAKYEKTPKTTQAGPAQFITQMMPVEKLWLALGTHFEYTDQQRQQIRDALAKVDQARKKQLRVLLPKMMTGRVGLEDIQTAAGVVESAMWKTLQPVLSFRQDRFARRWYSENTSMGFGGGPKIVLPPRGSSAFVHVDTETGKRQVFDFINIHPRSAGFKVRFHKDRLFNGMSTINVIFELNERFVLAEPLAFDLYRRVGSPACLTDFVRLQVNDDLVGYHLLFEQPNRAFLRRNGRDDSGNLYKLLWYGKGIEGKHEKKTNLDGGHGDLLEVLRELRQTKGQKEWEVIEKRFNVDQLINYFAVNMCLSHWDGFFNNFFAYHDVQGTGKWEMYPWDQDKTWGFHDGTGADEVFTDMPLTFGMEGDVPPGGGNPQMFGSWWRPGGEFSKPLLANPEFRKRYLSRLKTILTETYSEADYVPVIDALADRLRPEVTIRANALGENADQAQQRFERNIGLLKEHLTKRRAFLLEQDELKAASP